jgi:kinesin family protein 5
MSGPDIHDQEMRGIIPRMVQFLFDKIEVASEDIEFNVRVSFVEIYNERIKVNLKSNF